jgi:hypothetical protein
MLPPHLPQKTARTCLGAGLPFSKRTNRRHRKTPPVPRPSPRLWLNYVEIAGCERKSDSTESFFGCKNKKAGCRKAALGYFFRRDHFVTFSESV